MRKIGLLSFVICFLLALPVPLFAQTESPPAEPPPQPDESVIFTTENGDFVTHFWKEKYFGGGDGKPGNVLMAVGKGFIFQNAVLTKVETGTVPIPYTEGGSQSGYVTTYEGGQLVLNPRGPWKDIIILSDVTATNMSGRDGEGYLFFTLTFSGEDLKSGAFVDVTAWFYANDENYEKQVTRKGKPVFQRGYGFDAEIEITYPAEN